MNYSGKELEMFDKPIFGDIISIWLLKNLLGKNTRSWRGYRKFYKNLYQRKCGYNFKWNRQF